MQRMMLKFLLALSVAVLMGCANIATIHSPMLSVAEFGAMAQSELLTLSAGERVVAFTARVESDGETLRVVAITPTGQRLFSITRQGNELLTVPGPLWPAQMPLTAVWRDFEMTHARANAQLGADWQRILQHNGEEWWFRQQRQAQIVREDGKISLIRPEYQLSIEVLPE